VKLVGRFDGFLLYEISVKSCILLNYKDILKLVV